MAAESTPEPSESVGIEAVEKEEEKEITLGAAERAVEDAKEVSGEVERKEAVTEEEEGGVVLPADGAEEEKKDGLGKR